MYIICIVNVYVHAIHKLKIDWHHNTVIVIKDLDCKYITEHTFPILQSYVPYLSV